MTSENWSHGAVAYYDGLVYVNLSEIKPMIAMPFHPSNVYTIEDVNANLADVLHDVEQRALVSLDGAVDYSLQDKIVNGKLYVDQGIIAGCAGGGFENICAAADIIRGKYIGSDEFTFSVYPASTPIYMELVKNGAVADLMEAGTIVKTAFCGPCFGAGDTPANNAFFHPVTLPVTSRTVKEASCRVDRLHLFARYGCTFHCRNCCVTKVSLLLQQILIFEYKNPDLTHFDSMNLRQPCYFDSHGVADPSVEIKFGPNIKDWPAMSALPENLILKVVSEIHDPVTTTDELIPSGETSSYRSNPLGLAEFALSRKDPAYVGRAKEVQKAQKAIEAGTCPLDVLDELKPVMAAIQKSYPEVGKGNIGVGSTIFRGQTWRWFCPVNRLLPARRFSAAGRISRMSTQPNVTART